MIPRIIHQTWKTADLPENFRAYSATWRNLNPGWTHRIWTDRELLEFVATHYPDYLELFCSYRQGVQRADAGRYMLLHHFGGIYADMDTECLQSLEPLASENRIIISEEPKTHWSGVAGCRGFNTVLFNGVMVSPAKHAFWPHLLQRMVDSRHATDVLDSTGPYLLTGAMLSFPAKETLRIEDANFFNPVDRTGYKSPEHNGAKGYSLHHWSGTWWSKYEAVWWRRKIYPFTKRLFRLRAHFLGGERLDPVAARAAISPEAIAAPLPKGKNITILVPVRDASQHLAGFLAAIDKLDIPKERLKLVFCEGDSRDDTYDQLVRLTAPLKPLYRDIILLRKNAGTGLDHSKRWLPAVQRARRAGIARVRNYLIDHGVDATDDWALWIDVDVWSFPADILTQLFAVKARIVAPHCVLKPGGQCFDHNSFVTTPAERDHRYFRLVKDGIFQPPMVSPFRLKMSDLRHSDQVPLDGVGGTMLLVDATLHRGGLRFPEIPYDHLIETEGFGRMAKDLGITPIGLPRVEVLHVPW
ncbi:MAG TPA: glycosyltransferase [Verrucomicrobiae bacterium]|nr:glycosyltransferase [Verrucomicrobiae bacterium]